MQEEHRMLSPLIIHAMRPDKRRALQIRDQLWRAFIHWTSFGLIRINGVARTPFLTTRNASRNMLIGQGERMGQVEILLEMGTHIT